MIDPETLAALREAYKSVNESRCLVDDGPAWELLMSNFPALLAAARLERERWEARRELDEARAEIRRLSAWLALIDGGEAPCQDEAILRQAAYRAVTLGHEAPESLAGGGGA